MKLSFIIPVYGQIELTRACLDSLRATVRDYEYEIIIVNDGCTGETLEQLKELETENITIVHNDRNRGYAFSNNAGAHHATGEILFLLNNDLELLPNWLDPMVNAFRRKANAGIVGNIQLDFKTGEIDHSGYLIDWDASLKHKQTENKSWKGTPEYSKFHAITGACCAIKRTVYLENGGLDEAYTNGCEDIDLCFRLLKKGHRVYVANQSIVKHHVSATRKEAGLNEEKNFRHLQRRWKDDILRFAAYSWPNHYLTLIRYAPNTFNSAFLKEALVRWLPLKKSPAPTAIRLAANKLAANERHWKSLLDGLTDDEIKETDHTRKILKLNDIFTIEGFTGIDHDSAGYWIREKAFLRLPDASFIESFTLSGTLLEADPAYSEESGELGLKIVINDLETRIYQPLKNGPINIHLNNLPKLAGKENHIEISLIGTQLTDLYAYLGRVLKNKSYIPQSYKALLATYKDKRINKRLKIQKLRLNNEDVLDTEKDPSSPHVFDFIRRYGNLGINLVGWYQAQLGIGESVRLAAKALKASSLKSSFVPLKVNCLASQNDSSMLAELTSENPYPINIFHIDPAQCGDIDHHHGEDFRKDRYNIAYWAWELPEFPDAWLKYFKYFDEIWTPSDFVRDAIALKSPIPVLTMPHPIQFPKPDKNWRSRLELPKDKFLFSFIYDLNSYQERKNPLATIKAFKLAFSGTEYEDKVGLVIKTQSVENNREQFELLKEALTGIKNYYIIDQTLSREAVYGLMRATDAYVSLHRSEGFGLTVAESMYLGKPVLSTDWSATTEFVKGHNGCPIRCKLIELEKNYGPYLKGQIWADPDSKHAAEMMGRLYKDKKYYSYISYNAAKSIRQQFAPKRIAQLYEKRIKAISLW